MNDDSITVIGRLRAGLASLLASLAGGAHRLEQWSSRGTRPILLGLVGIAVLAFGALAIVSGGHAVGRWLNPRPHPVEARESREAPPRPPAPKPHGKPIGKPEGGPDGPRAERPAPPAPPVPPVPPVGATRP